MPSVFNVDRHISHVDYRQIHPSRERILEQIHLSEIAIHLEIVCERKHRIGGQVECSLFGRSKEKPGSPNG
jgi:hypothetical protein